MMFKKNEVHDFEPYLIPLGFGVVALMKKSRGHFFHNGGTGLVFWKKEAVFSSGISLQVF